MISNKLKAIVGFDNVKENEPMKNHTSFKIGGNADILVLPSNEDELKKILTLVNEHNIPFTIIGNGSNLLVRDNGIRGVVIKISSRFKGIEVNDNYIIAKAGTLLPSIAQVALKNSLEGFEFAAGIPGTLGGAITMNAGAHGGEMKDIVTSVTLMDYKGNIHVFSNDDMKFSYRDSILSSSNHIVLSATFKLAFGDASNIKSKMDEYKHRRIYTQPLNYPNAGSTFKRVENTSVGKILQDLNLKGLSLNGAKVSKKHGGFIVNVGEDTRAQDVLNLIDVIKLVVKEKCNLSLEEEVRVIGEE